MNTESNKISPDLQKFLEGEDPSLEQQVETMLTSLNRHDRRAWCARLCRKAGRVRDRALRAKKTVKQ